MPDPAHIERLVSALTEQKVGQLLVELLTETGPKPAVPVPARRGRRPAKLDARARYVAKRSASVTTASACSMTASSQPVPIARFSMAMANSALSR